MTLAPHPKPELSVHFIDCGQGNMTILITPSMTIVYDCRIIEEDEERILDHLKTYLPDRLRNGEVKQWIDWFICSHRDQDHIHGLNVLNREFPIRGIVDPGTTSGSTTGAENEYYMRLRRAVKESYGDSALIVPEPSTTSLFEYDEVKFYCLCSGKDDPPSEEGHYGNNVFQVEYAGRRILLTGDSDWRAWKEKILPKFKDSGLLSTTILAASHHGSRSFFVDTDPEVDESIAWETAFLEHLDVISPSMTIISCGQQKAKNHPNPTALEKYRKGTDHKQAYLSRDVGTLIGQFHSNGFWTVTPSRFLSAWSHSNFCTPGRSISVRCSAYKGENLIGAVRPGDRMRTGCNLRFEVDVAGLPVASSMSDYTFEVSNGGAGAHDTHDDIYSEGKSGKGKPNTFSRDLSYEGLHLLRCEVRSPFIKGQFIFPVQGVSS